VVAVQLIELHSLGRFDGVIHANRNRNQQKTYVAFPNRSHRGSSLGSPTSLSAARGHLARSYPLATASGFGTARHKRGPWRPHFPGYHWPGPRRDPQGGRIIGQLAHQVKTFISVDWSASVLACTAAEGLR